MVESVHLKEMEDLGFSTTIEGYYIEENQKSVNIRLPDSISFWVPKRFIDTQFFRETDFKQEFLIDNWILRKIGLRLDKVKKIDH